MQKDPPPQRPCCGRGSYRFAFTARSCRSSDRRNHPHARCAWVPRGQRSRRHAGCRCARAHWSGSRCGGRRRCGDRGHSGRRCRRDGSCRHGHCCCGHDLRGGRGDVHLRSRPQRWGRWVAVRLCGTLLHFGCFLELNSYRRLFYNKVERLIAVNRDDDRENLPCLVLGTRIGLL